MTSPTDNPLNKNREIKFRAWLTDGDGITYSKGSHMDYEVTVQKGKYASIEGGWDIQGLYDYPLMQYTGLKDKNGVEIYEGDIVHHTYAAPGETEFDDIFAVAWDEEGYWSTTEYPGDFEVIGNIYENPELLEHSS